MNILNTVAAKATVQLGAAASATYAYSALLSGVTLTGAALAVYMSWAVAVLLGVLIALRAANAAGAAYERYASTEACERHGEAVGRAICKVRNLFSRSAA